MGVVFGSGLFLVLVRRLRGDDPLLHRRIFDSGGLRSRCRCKSKLMVFEVLVFLWIMVFGGILEIVVVESWQGVLFFVEVVVVG